MQTGGWKPKSPSTAIKPLMSANMYIIMFKLLNLSPIPSFSMAEDRQEVWGLQLPSRSGENVFNSLFNLRGLRCPALRLRTTAGL